jgi:hypothetical protein
MNTDMEPHFIVALKVTGGETKFQSISRRRAKSYARIYNRIMRRHGGNFRAVVIREAEVKKWSRPFTPAWWETAGRGVSNCPLSARLD